MKMHYTCLHPIWEEERQRLDLFLFGEVFGLVI
jgi:hypothetical protein